MYPYVAFLRNAQDPHANVVAQTLTNQFRQTHRDWALLDGGTGLSLFHAPPPGRSLTAIVLPSKSGAVLGTLFPKDLDVSPRGESPIIDEQCAEEIVRTCGRHLMDKYWGGYVAFVVNRDGTVHHVLRDCSGKLQCYTIAHGDITVITANIEDLACLPLPPFSINARFLAGFVYNAEFAHRDCALKEVKELMAGECLELKAGQAQFARKRS